MHKLVLSKKENTLTMKKILFVSNYRASGGGISVQVEKLKKHLVKEGYIVDIFSTKDSLLKRLGMPSKLRNIISDYDLVHVHCCSSIGFFPAVLGIKVAKKMGKRIVLTYHGGGAEKFFRKHHRLVKHYLLQTETNIIPSPFLSDIFNNYGIPSIVIPNIIELDERKFQKRNVLHPWFVCIRSHDDVYNIPCVLKAFQIIQQKMPESRLYLLGDGSQHEALKKMTEDMGINNVTFTGRIANDKIYEYLDKSDIMLNSPIIDNMPVSLLEAMNSGLLVVSSNVGGIPYMVENGKTGLLFESDNHESMAEKIIWALHNQDKALDIIDNAYSEVSKYTWDKIRGKIINVYEQQ